MCIQIKLLKILPQKYSSRRDKIHYTNCLSGFCLRVTCSFEWMWRCLLFLNVSCYFFYCYYHFVQTCFDFAYDDGGKNYHIVCGKCFFAPLCRISLYLRWFLKSCFVGLFVCLFQMKWNDKPNITYNLKWFCMLPL